MNSVNNKYIVDDVVLQRLANPKAEIRIEALKELTVALKNNLSTTDDTTVVYLTALVKSLIRWFQFRPINHETEVLNLLIFVFSKKQLLGQVVRDISVLRLKKELEKIKLLTISAESLGKLQTLTQFLCDYEQLIHFGAGSFNELSSSQFSFMSTPSVDLSMVERQKSITERSITPSINKEVEDDRGEFWEVLKGANLDTFNGIKAELSLEDVISTDASNNLHNVLNFLITAIEDYPPEFFLQPPNILGALLQIAFKAPNDTTVIISKIVRLIINAIKERCLGTSINQDEYAINCKKHVNNVLRILTSYFERFHECYSSSYLIQNQDVLNEIYLLLNSLAAFINLTNIACEIFLNELMNIVAKLAKDLRLSYLKEGIGLIRLHYIIVINIINNLVASVDTENISKFCENNSWEAESDVALLDVPLKISHPKIYAMITSNREDVINDDNDLTALLNVQQSWKPFVDVMQDWQHLSPQEILFKGVDAISMMRIHENILLVDLLLDTIEKASPEFSGNQELKEVAEEIFIRLISVDVPKLRERTYANARSKIRKRMQGDCEFSGSLCCVVGFPLTTEIVTEILCFGFTDNNESIQESSKIILFALLRSKMIFKTHWLEIIDIIKPILPLMTCLINTNEKIGEFVVDIYRQHSGFDEFEINQAYARFLYCNHQRVRNTSKDKLLQNLGFPDDLIRVVPDNFCLVNDQFVSDLNVPEGRIGYDADSYKKVRKMFSTLGSVDSDIVRSVLLQLSVMMNSKKMCLDSHDDNLWIFFMASLDMGNPNCPKIRKLTINILYKWVVCKPSFRIYLSTEASVIDFIIKTLVQFQEDVIIKTQSSWLLFLLLFSDFIVTNERTTSMPKFLSTLSCPFKFETHWVDSPFNKVTLIEQLYEAMQTNEGADDIREISRKYLKFCFALEWFKSSSHLTEVTDDYKGDCYYQNFGRDALRIDESLQLSDDDAKSIQHSDCQGVLRNLCSQLDNATSIAKAHRLILQLKIVLLTFFNSPAATRICAEVIDKSIDRLTIYAKDNKDQQKMFIGFLQIYQIICPFLKDDRIVNVFNKKFFLCMLLEDFELDEDSYLEALKVINCIVKLCHSKPTLMELLIKTFEQQHSIYLPSRIVEKFYSHLIRDNKKWYEVDKKPILREALVIVRNVLSFMPVHLDDAYLGQMFKTLLDSTLDVYKYHLNLLKSSTTLHVHSSTIKRMLSINEVIASKVKNLKLTNECLKKLSFWAKCEGNKYKYLPWMIISHFTEKKENFVSFCKAFESATHRKLFDDVETILTVENISNWTNVDQNALSAVLANILEHDTLVEPISGFETRSFHLLIKQFIVLNNTRALSFLVRKMIQTDFVESTDIVVNRGIISLLLRCDSARLSTNSDVATYQKVTEMFETVAVCYKHKPLKDHVVEIVANEAKANFMNLFCDSKIYNEASTKKFNHSAFNLMLIMIQSEVGLMRICKMLTEPQVIDQVIFASHDNLRVTNHHKELMFQLNFWLTLLEACEKYDSPIIDILSGHEVEITSGNCMIVTTNGDSDKTKTKIGTMLENNLGKVRYAIDLLILQIVNIFDFAYSSKFSSEYKHEMIALCFVLIRKLTLENHRVRHLSNDINLISVITGKLDLALTVMQNYRYLETTKKNGVQKCQYMIKDLCIFIKALIEWQLPLEVHGNVVKEVFKNVLKVHDWLKADSVLLNCFFNFLRVIVNMEIGLKCLNMEFDGKPIIKAILTKTMELAKLPHTPNNLSLMRNGIEVLKTASQFIDIRMILKNSKIFSMLEILHPHIGNNRRTIWDDITVDWLDFFEFLSRFEDTECLPNRVSLLCRLFRLGGPKIKRRSIIIIRNFSMRSSIGIILINSEDFKHTVDDILEDSTNAQEKMIILETLLSIASASEQLKAKLKNSPLNRKLKYQLKVMQSDSKFISNPENVKILSLTSMLSQVLYPEE